MSWSSDRAALLAGLASAVLAIATAIQTAAGGDSLTGEEWRRLPPPARAAYVSGIVDAWSGLVSTQESLGNKDVAITVFIDVVGCVRDRLMSPARIHALVEQYAEDNPGLRSKDMPDIVFAALTQHCRR